MASSLESQLMKAVFAGDISSMCFILDQGISLNFTDSESGFTLLMTASHLGHLNTVKTLIDRGFPINATSTLEDGGSALMCAVQEGRSEVVSLLLERKADVNAGFHSYSRQSPLYYAALDGRSSITLSLLQYGASVDAQDWRGVTALAAASKGGHFDCVKVLTDHRASVEVGDRQGLRPLHHAAKNNHARIVELLIEKGALVDQVDNFGVTPLMRAAQFGAEDSLQVLLSKGADMGKFAKKIEEKRGKLNHKKPEKHKRNYVKRQIWAEQEKRYEKINEVDIKELGDNDGLRPLHIAAKNNQARVVELLIEKGALVDQVDNTRATPLMRAAQYGAAESLQMLLSKGADKEKLAKTRKKQKAPNKIRSDRRNIDEKKIEDDKQEAKRKRELEEKKVNDKRQQEEIEREILRKREQDKIKTDSNQEIKSRFEKICNEASTCLINNEPSIEGFSRALEMIDKEYNSLWSTSQYIDISHNEEVVVIKYMFAIACGETNNYDSILAGLKKLDEIRDLHKPVSFPTVFYGLASLWIKLNRFDEAMAAVNGGIEFLDQGFDVTPHNWPGIPSKLVEETKKDTLLEKLTTFKKELKYPPSPDAVCRWKDCIKIQSHIVPSEKIYILDSDYKGYFKIVCRMDCQVCYHKACWKAVKGDYSENLRLDKVPSEKDFLGRSCLTPDCEGKIVKIEIFDDQFAEGKIIQDTKLIEKLEDEERNRKEEKRLKKEREWNEKRVKIFENKQMKKNDEKHSNNKKEKGGENNVTSEKNLNKQKKDKILNWRNNEKKQKGTAENCEEEEIRIQEIKQEAMTQDAASVITIQKMEQPEVSSKTVPKDSSRMSEKASESLHAPKQSLGDIARKMKEEIKEKYVKDSPRQISSIENDSTELDENVTNFKNNSDLGRTLKAKEYNEKCMAMVGDINNLKIENDVHKDHISKIKKAVSDPTKSSTELKKTTEVLNKTKSQLKETKTSLREELFQFNSQLASLSRTKDAECRTCDELRVRLLHNEFKKYSDILEQRQANNLRVITHLIESSELNQLPQVQIALNTLNEFSARLLVAEEELNDQYESLVRQSRGSKVIRELKFDLSSVEPPNLGPSYLNHLHSFIIMNPLQTSSPFSFTSVPAPSISQSSSISSAPNDPHGNQVVARPSPTPPTEYKRNTPAFPGIPEFSSSLAGLPPFLPSSTSQDSFATSISQSTINVTHRQNLSQLESSAACLLPGANIEYPSNGVTSTTPSSGATATLGPTLIPKNSATTCSIGPNNKTDQPGSKTGKPHDDLVSRVQKDHPGLSQEKAFKYVMELRASNNGKLSGMVRQDILNKVASFIRRDRSNVDGASTMERNESNVGALERNGSIVDGANIEDKECSICFEDMIDSDTLYLNPCRHRFHTECINQWLESPGGAGSTCPMCRNYIVKENEFPKLG